METAEKLSPKAQVANVAKALDVTMDVVFVPWSQSRNKAKKFPSLNWVVTLKRHGREFLTTDYGAGSGHCPGYKFNDRSLDRAALVKWECEHGYAGFIGSMQIMRKNKDPLRPALEDVLYSLVSDASVLDESSFEDWASSLGYDTDSRKAESIYRACLDIALKLRNAVGEEGLRLLRDACQDY